MTTEASETETPPVTGAGQGAASFSEERTTVDALRPSQTLRGSLVETRIVEADRPDGKPSREAIVDILVEGFGNKRDGHYYSRQLIEGYFDQFGGARQYADHLDEAAERKLAGMPRSVRDLAGRIKEAWVDTNDQGKRVIRARCSIAQDWLWNLIESDADLVGLSINARGVSRPGTVEGRPARIVESVTNVRSVDWVSEPGAGGRVVALVEAQIEAEADAAADPTEETPVDTTATIDELEDAVDAALAESDADEDQDDVENDDLEPASDDADDAELDDEGTEVDPAEGESAEHDEGEELEEGDFDGEVSADDLHAVLGHPTVRRRIAGLVESTAHTLASERLTEAVDAAIDETSKAYDELLEAERGKHARDLEQVRQRYEAAKLLEGSGLKKASILALKEDFFDRLFEAEYDDDGVLVKDADDVLKEAVSEAVAERSQEIAAYKGARISGLGGELLEASRLGDGAPKRTAPKRPVLDDRLNERLGA